MHGSYPVITVTSLTKIFESRGLFIKHEKFTAVDNITFELQKDEILGILGSNGAGKTTTIKMLLGLLTPTAGSIYYFGKNLQYYRAEIMQQVSFASSYLKLPGSLSIEENLNLYARLYCVPEAIRTAQIDKNLKLFGLKHIKNRLTKKLSAGQLTRLMLAKAFLPNPKIILLDEPTAALDPDIALQVRAFILDQRQLSGISVILTSHNMAEVEEVCDRVLILQQGKIIASETPAKLAATVKTSKLRLLVTAHFDKLLLYAQEKNIHYTLNQNFIELPIDEHTIADFMFDIAQLHVKYTQISINKPTLEDYFLAISQ